MAKVWEVSDYNDGWDGSAMVVKHVNEWGEKTFSVFASVKGDIFPTVCSANLASHTGSKKEAKKLAEDFLGAFGLHEISDYWEKR